MTQTCLDGNVQQCIMTTITVQICTADVVHELLRELQEVQ